MVDAYSKWVEIALMASTTSESVIRILRKLFATHGLTDLLVSDNVPQLISTMLQVFLAEHGIWHAQVAPFHPACNGMVERVVRSAKDILAKFGLENWQEKIVKYLLAQHTTSCPQPG